MISSLNHHSEMQEWANTNIHANYSNTIPLRMALTLLKYFKYLFTLGQQENTEAQLTKNFLFLPDWSVPWGII